MANDVQVFSASQVIPFDAPDLECPDRLSIERGEGRNVYRVWYPLGEAAPSVRVSKGVLQFKVTGSEVRTTYPQFAAEEEVPDNTIIFWAQGEGDDTLYYGVREESVEWSFNDYRYFGNTSEDEPPAFMLAVAVYDHEDSERPCLAMAFSQINASDATCSGTLSIESGEGRNVYRVWYPLGAAPPLIRVSKGGLEFVKQGTDTKVSYPTFSGVEELPTDGTVLISQSIRANETTLHYGVQEIKEGYAYVEYRYFGVISENEAPAFMIAYGVYENPEEGAQCPVFVSTQVSMADDTCSATISIESGTGDDIYRIWYPIGGPSPTVLVSRGVIQHTGAGSEDRVSYPQFSGEPSRPPGTILSYTKTDANTGTRLHYGVRKEVVNTAFVDYTFFGNTNPGIDPAFLLALGVYNDPETQQPCIGFATSQVSERDTSSCDDRLGIERGVDPDVYNVVSSGCNPTVEVSKGSLTPEGSWPETRERYQTFSGVEEPEGSILIEFTANGLKYGVAKVSESVNVYSYKFEGAIRGVGEPAYMIAYCVAPSGGKNDDGSAAQCVAFTSMEVGTEIDLLCNGRLNIADGDRPNEVVVYAFDGVGGTPTVSISKGTLTLLRQSPPMTREEPRVFQNEESLPTGNIILLEEIEGRYYGVVLEDITEVAYTYGYTPPLEDLPYLCLKEDDPNYDSPPDAAFMFAWAVYPPDQATGQAENCVAFASSRVSYDCPEIPQCETPFDLSISSGESANTAVVTHTPTGPSGKPLVPVFQTINGVMNAHPERTIEEEIDNVVQFSAEAEEPDTAIASFKIGELFYGWKTESKTVKVSTYNVRFLDGNDDISDDMTIYGYIADGPCMAFASASIPIVIDNETRISRYGEDPVQECWVQLEHKDSELLYMTYERKGIGTPTLDSIHCGLRYRGRDTTNMQKIVEFQDEEKKPDNTLFFVRRPNYDRYSSGRSKYDSRFGPRELYYGFRLEDTESVREIYEIIPENPSGTDVMFAYAYFEDSKDCHDYAQIMIPPPYEEPQFEEFEVYRVVSRVIATEEGVYACPGPDYDQAIKNLFEDEDLYQISELVHEQGYINQFWNRHWARPEIHHHKDYPRHRLLASVSVANPDLYIEWNPVSNIVDVNTPALVNAGRPIHEVYSNLSSVGSIPLGVTRRWGTVRLIGPQLPI